MDLNIKTSNGKEYSLPVEDQHEMLVRKTIHRTDNPHPALLICIIIIIIMLIYYIYIYGIKNNVTGSWYVNSESIYLSHDSLSDNIYNNGHLCGYVRGNAVFIYNVDPNELPFMGTMHNKKIYWNTGSIWTHIQYT